jgi:hypothetical protein
MSIHKGMYAVAASVLLVWGIAQANPDPDLMVYSFGADYHYHASESYVGDWQWDSGPIVQILYDNGGVVANANYFMGPYYGPNDQYFGSDGEFILVDESEDDGFYASHSDPPDSVIVDLFHNDLVNVYIVATIYEDPMNGTLSLNGVPATWDSMFNEANGWDQPGASSFPLLLGNLMANTLTPVALDMTGYTKVDFWAFSDEDGNGCWNPSEKFSPSSHNLTLNGGDTGIFEEGMRVTPTKARLLWNSGSYSLDIEGASGSGRVDIYNVLGRRVLSERFDGGHVDLSLAQIPAGIYRVIATVGASRPISEFIVIP